MMRSFGRGMSVICRCPVFIVATFFMFTPVVLPVFTGLAMIVSMFFSPVVASPMAVFWTICMTVFYFVATPTMFTMPSVVICRRWERAGNQPNKKMSQTAFYSA